MHKRFISAIALAAFGALVAAAAPAVHAGRLASGEHYANLPEVRLHYTVAGEGPLLIVCSPGWGISADYLERGLAPLEKHYKLLFIDTRGSGKSSRPADPSKMSDADMATDIEHLRQYLGLQSIWLLGHSGSGSIVIDYAERYPSFVQKLIVVDGIIYGDRQFNRQFEAQREQLRKDRHLSSDPRYRAAMQHLLLPASRPKDDEEMSQDLILKTAAQSSVEQRNS
ncbi:MAG: alpha/beta fold hydrolase [Terriglobia bacterium]